MDTIIQRVFYYYWIEIKKIAISIFGFIQKQTLYLSLKIHLKNSYLKSYSISIYRYRWMDIHGWMYI